MRIVGKIPYKSVSPKIIEEIEKNASQGYDAQVILDSASEQMLVVVE
jgi:hypothetical protein